MASSKSRLVQGLVVGQGGRDASVAGIASVGHVMAPSSCLDESLGWLRLGWLFHQNVGDFQARLDVARDVLADRLSRLTDHGVFERSVYQGRPVRYEYLLTDKGRDLVPVLVAMVEWGDRYHAPDGPAREIVHADCGGAVERYFTCGACRAGLEAHEISSRPGPGSGRHAQPPQPVAAS